MPEPEGKHVFVSYVREDSAAVDELCKVLEAAGHEPDIRLAGDGAIGAAVLALRHQGITVDEVMLQRITASMTARAAKT